MKNRIQKMMVTVVTVFLLATGLFGVCAERAQAQEKTFHAFEVLPKTMAQAKTSNPRVLFVGNSLTFYNDLPEMFRQICKKNGINAQVSSVTKGAHTLTRYVHPLSQYSEDKVLHKELMSKLKREKWDYVILQDQRYAAIRDKKDMQNAVSELETLIKKAGAQMVLYETWAPQRGHFDYNGKRPVAADPAEYQSKVAEMYYGLAAKHNCALSPAGIAFARAKRIYPNLNLYVDDKLHPNAAGTYLSACTMYATIFGKSPEGTSYYPAISGKTSQERVKICKKLQALAADVTIRGAVANNAELKFADADLTLKTNVKKTLNYQIVPSVKGARVTYWSSNNEKVASVDENGTVTTHRIGNADIIAILNNGKKAVCRVSVSQGNIQLGTGERYKLQYDQDYRWTSNNPKVAVVQNNQIRAKKTGVAILTGTRGESKITIKVTVKGAPTSLHMNREKTIAVGKTGKIKVSFGSGISVNGVKYTSSNPNIVTVDQNGTIYGKRAGKARITAKAYNGKRAVCTVRVINQAQNIKFANAKGMVELRKGRSKLLKVTFYPQNTSIKKLVWKSGNPKVVSVTKNGKIRGLKRGGTVITAKTTDGSNIRIKIKVKVR